MSPVALEPLWSNLLLTLEPEPEKSSIIAVQNSLVGLTRFAVVKAVGPEVRDIKVGQRVLASVTAGIELPNGMLINEAAVLGIRHE